MISTCGKNEERTVIPKRKNFLREISKNIYRTFSSQNCIRSVFEKITASFLKSTHF